MILFYCKEYPSVEWKGSMGVNANYEPLFFFKVHVFLMTRCIVLCFIVKGKMSWRKDAGNFSIFPG